MELRRNQIEARAQQAVEAVLPGGRVEDDQIECKSDWPEETKVRQLAAHANRANGEPIIWLIGLDENAHKLTQPSALDPADWWARMAKRFDDVAPDMTHVTVHLDEGRTVTALAFTTDLTPYVISTENDEPRVEREVPIREGTATRSAHRRDLLRLLAPAMTVPQAVPVSAVMTLAFANTPTPRLALRVRVFFEHPGGGTAMLPTQRMRARVDFDHRPGPSDLPPVKLGIVPVNPQAEIMRPARAVEPPSGPVPFGVEPRKDGLIITGSGTVSLSGSAQIDEASPPRLSQVPTVNVRWSLAVAGTNRRVEFHATLQLVPPAEGKAPRWEFAEPDEDPWVEEPEAPA